MRTTFSVSQKDFELNKESALRDILTEKSYADVTLVCNDDKHVDAHRIILSSQSLFFKRLLQMNSKRGMLIYLHNVSSGDMETILEFIYLGQTEISEQYLERFLMLGTVFEIMGLNDQNFKPTGDPLVTKILMESGYEGEGLLINKSLMNNYVERP